MGSRAKHGLVAAASAFLVSLAVALAVGTFLYGRSCGLRVPTYFLEYLLSFSLWVLGFVGIILSVAYCDPGSSAVPYSIVIAFLMTLVAVVFMGSACPDSRTMVDALSPLAGIPFVVPPLACAARRLGRSAPGERLVVLAAASVALLGASLAYAVYAYGHMPGSNIYVYYSADKELRAALPLASRLADAARRCGYKAGLAEYRITPGTAEQMGLDTLPAVVMPRGLYEHMTTGFPCIDPLYYQARHWRGGLVVVHGSQDPP